MYLDKPAKFIVISGDANLSKNNNEYIKKLNDSENKDGQNIKIIIGSVVSSEGIDLKNIREIHIMDPWHHLNRMEQIIGRGIRYCSHTELEDINGYSKHNVMIYLHVATLNDKNRETVDISIYRMAEEKSIYIGNIENILKKNAVDCELFRHINIIGKNDVKPIKLLTSNNTKIENYLPYDKKYSKACSFTDECNYKCGTKKTLKKKINMNTFNNKLGKNIYLFIYKYISALYNIKDLYQLNEIIDYINQYIKVDKKIICLAIDNMIKNKITFLSKNTKGYIIYNNKYYIFQPTFNNDATISINERTNNITNKLSHLDLSMKNIELITTISEDTNKVDDTIKYDNIIKIYLDYIDNLTKNKKIDPKFIKKYELLNNDAYKRFEINDTILLHMFLDRLNMNEKISILKHIIKNYNKIIQDKSKTEYKILDYYRFNLIYNIDGNYSIDRNSLDDINIPIGVMLYNIIKPEAYILNDDKMDINSAIYEDIMNKLKTYMKEDNYKRRYTNLEDVWVFTYYYKDKMRVRIVTKEMKPPVITNTQKTKMVKYGLECYGDTKGFLDNHFKKMLEKIDAKLIDTVYKESNPPYQKNMRCNIFEAIARKESDKKKFFYGCDRFFYG